jgi:folate-binding protein YgfZ
MVKLMRIPAYDWHQQKGAVFEDYFGCEVPSHYGDFQDEYKRLRNEFVIRDVSHFGKIKVTGRDRSRFLQGMLTNDIKALDSGKGTFALFLDVKGHIHADMKVYAFPDHLLLVLQHYLVEKLMLGLDRYIMSEDVRMQDVSAEMAMVQILGPKSSEYLQTRGVNQFPEASYHHRSTSAGGSDFTLIRLPAGFVLLEAAGSGQTNLLEFLGGPMIGAKAFEVFRIESGIPLMQKDMDETNFPQECGLDAALDFQKGCYLGQETMARIDAQGHVNRHLVGIASSVSVASGDKIFRENKEVGRITSATHSLMLRKPFALGYIRREFATEGARVEVGSNNTTAIVRELPLKP